MIGRIIKFFEKDRVNIVGVFLIIMLFGFLRNFLQQSLVHERLIWDIQSYSAMMFTQLSMFLGGSLILSYFSKENSKKVMNAGVLIVWLITLVPVLDAFVFNVPPTFDYFNTKLYSTEDIDQLLTGGLSAGHSPGIFSMGLIIVLLAGSYMFFKTKSVLRAGFGFLVFYLFCFFFAGQFYIPIILRLGLAVTGGLDGIILSFVFGLLLIYKDNKRLAATLLKTIKPLKTLYFILLVVCGIIIGGNFGHILIYLSSTLTRIFIITFIWQFTIVLNNIFDEKIDRLQKKKTPITSDLISKDRYFQIGIIFLLLSILTSLLTGNLIIVTITCLALLSSILYSAPPFRLRDRIFSTWFIGFGSVVAFLIGYLKIGGDEFSLLLLPPISLDIIYLLLILFFSVTIGTTIKDMEDYEGDKKYGVKTIFTIFGLEKGKTIVTVLLFLSFLMPILLFNRFSEIVLFSILAISASVLFRKLENQKPIVLLSLLVFAYCALRLSGIF